MVAVAWTATAEIVHIAASGKGVYGNWSRSKDLREFSLVALVIEDEEAAVGLAKQCAEEGGRTITVRDADGELLGKFGTPRDRIVSAIYAIVSSEKPGIAARLSYCCALNSST